MNSSARVHQLARLGSTLNDAPVQRMESLVFGGFNGFEALDELDDETQSEQSEEEDGFDEEVDGWTFDDITTPDFRTNHVVGAGDLIGMAEAVASQRKKPVSTTVQFLDDDRAKLVAKMQTSARAVNLNQPAPNSLQAQTTNWTMLYAEVRKNRKGAYKVTDVDFGKMQYAAQGIQIMGGTMYEVNHLDGMEK